MVRKLMPSQAGRNTTATLPDPVFVNGSSATSGESSVQQKDPKADKRIRVGWHWTYGWLRRPECDEPFGYAYEEPDGDLVFIGDVTAKKRVMLQCCEDQFGERYICLHKD